MLTLNLGCGALLIPGAVNVDSVDLAGVDVVHDLDRLPWPFGDRSFGEVVATDVFEHVTDPLGFMAECWRVLEPDGLLRIRTSYWRSENSYTDPTHRRFCTERTFDYWIPGTGYHERYGAAYARGVSFGKEDIRVDGQELVAVLRRLP